MEDINNDLFPEEVPTPRIGEALDSFETAFLADYNPPPLPKKLPRLIELLLSNYDERYWPMLAMAALPVLSAHASHYRAWYLNGRVVGPQLFVAIMGGSGQGKGRATDLFNEMVEHTLKAWDDMEWAKVAENERLRDQKANAKDRPEKYAPRLRLFETTSKSSIMELMTHLGDAGMMLGQFSEVDGLFKSTKQSYSDVSVTLRKGWDGDYQRQYYLSESSCNSMVRMNISLLMAGTIRAMLGRMFSDTENGMMQRCMPVLLPRKRRTFRPPMQNFLGKDEVLERDSLLMQLFQRDTALGSETKCLELPRTNKLIGQWYDDQEVRYNDGEITYAEADLSNRVGEFMIRAAIPLVALYGEESKVMLGFIRWVGDFSFYNLCYLFGHRVQRDMEEAEGMMAEAKTDHRKTALPILDRLPEVFDTKLMQEQRRLMNQSPDVRALLHNYVKQKRIERIGRGVYRKVMS